MIYYERIDVSEGIDVNKTNVSRQGDACHYQYFLNFSFTFQSNFCKRSHGLLMISVNLSNVTILDIKHFDYCCLYYKFNYEK